jgi:hypothetical protein
MHCFNFNFINVTSSRGSAFLLPKSRESVCCNIIFSSFYDYLWGASYFIAGKNLLRLGRERCLQGFDWEARREETTGRPRRRWEDYVMMDLKEIGIDGASWIRLAQDRVQWRAFVSTVMNLRVP